MKKILLVLCVIPLFVLTLTACSRELGLTVREPRDGEVVRTSSLVVRGDLSHSDARLTVNDAEVSVHSEYRTFYHTVNLVEGQNTITFIASLGEEQVTKTVTVTFEQ